MAVRYPEPEMHKGMEFSGTYYSPLFLMLDRCDDNRMERFEKSEWLTKLIDAHINAARWNDNLSKGVFVAASKGNTSFVNSVIAALASIGGLHAPVWEARQVIFRQHDAGDRVPGFGNSFFKDKIDPAFSNLWTDLKGDYPETVKQVLNCQPSKDHAPNAAAITAAVCELIGYPDGLESEIFIHARLAVWADCYKLPPTLLG